MDQATRRLRARNKKMTNGRGHLPEFEARGLGRKLKPAETFPLKQCEFIEGGKRTLIFRRRKDGTRYAVPIIKGGKRCTESALTKGRCLGHLNVEQ